MDKEKYELLNDNCIYDNNSKEYTVNPTLSMRAYLETLTKLLNQQDIRIKELENELSNYKLCRCVDCSNECQKGLETFIAELERENKQLKQLQNKKIVGELEKLKLSILDFSNGYWHYFNKTGDAYMTSRDLEGCLKEFMVNQIKELKGE